MITKEMVLDAAKKFGLTLTDAQVDEYVKANKLPEEPKATYSAGTRKEELVAQHSKEQLADLLLETRSEARDRRLELRELQTKFDGLNTELNKNKELIGKVPELETQLKAANDAVAKVKAGEKARREAVLAKLDKEQAEALSYLTDVDVVANDKFDATVQLVTKAKTDGQGNTHPPKGIDGYDKPNPFAKKTLNLAEQVKLTKESPALAEKLKEAASKEK